MQLLTSLAFPKSCRLFSFQGDTSDLLKGLIETNASVLMRLFRVLIRPASWLFPKCIIYFSSISRLSGLNKSACLSQMNFLGSPSIRVSVCLPKDRKFNKRVEHWHVSMTARYWLPTVLPALSGCGEPRLLESRCVHSGLGEKRMLHGEGVFYRKDGRIINA